MDFSKLNFGVDGDSITAGEQWSHFVYKELGMASHHNVAVGSAVWYKRTIECASGKVTTQNYTAPDFAGCFDAISISLNESTAKKYDAICHSVFGEDAFSGILDFARRVKAYVPQVALSVVRQFLSPESLAECKHICEEIHVPIKIREYISN